MPYKLIGRTTTFKGKSLWEILGNLKKFGIGRMVSRNTLQRYIKPSYMKIIKVKTLPNADDSFEVRRKIITLVEKTFCGVSNKKPVQLESATYKTDYFLIHKYNELHFFQTVEVPIMKVFPDEMEFPPLVKEIMIRQSKINGIPITNEPLMKIIYNKSKLKMCERTNKGKYQIVQKLSIGLGTPITFDLYHNLIK